MRSVLLCLGLFFGALPSVIHAQAFSDVSGEREEYAAVEDLQARGIFEGRPDGTFGPDDYVNRAEAITVVVRAVANVRNLPAFDTCFPDVTGDAWYVQPICYAADLAWVSGYPDGTFQPVRTVAKVEFLKILLNAYGTDVDQLADLRDPLAPDARNPDEWFMSFLQYAVFSGMTSADDFGNLNPGAALTRGQVALMMHRFLLFREGKRDQALLGNAEKDIRALFNHLDALEVQEAGFALGRLKLTSRSALERLPDSSVTQLTSKVADALDALVFAYRSVQIGDLDNGLSAAQRAYHHSDEADALHEAAKIYTDRIRTYAHELADDIRAHTDE